MRVATQCRNHTTKAFLPHQRVTTEGKAMPEFEINHQIGISLRELIDFRQWTESQLCELWRLQPGDGVNVQGQLVRRIK
ncbi:hypothetical protein DN555_25270 [Enterobacter asburiae]|nr:hypothetical protein AWI17_15085 [Enterobacter asburiae]RWT08184.1 hypothetical protein DN555_25270 [Enterobacter asburiae]CZW93457.1 Uncharacterised protein [Enterobacter cloacae]CZY50438.1 Uncharacterised protein [Enterobacter cloacae]